jgi:hypothetical protein
MATQFNTLFGTYAFPALLTMYGQSTTYRPVTGSTRAITAIIHTDEITIAAFAQDVASVRAVVQVLNNGTSGILASELNLGGDRLDVPLRNGESASILAIKHIINDEAGVTTLACY